MQRSVGVHVGGGGVGQLGLEIQPVADGEGAEAAGRQRGRGGGLEHGGNAIIAV